MYEKGDMKWHNTMGSSPKLGNFSKKRPCTILAFSIRKETLPSFQDVVKKDM